MVSVVQESAVQKTIEENKRTTTTSVINSLSTLNPTFEISVSDHSRAKRPTCKYVTSNQSCPYGNQCRYRHPPKPNKHVKPVCRHYLHGECRYGNRCKFDHPKVLDETENNETLSTTRDDQSTVLNTNDFPSISQSKDRITRVQPKNLEKPNYSIPPSEQKRVLHQQDGSRLVPVELQLEAFFKRAATITPRPSVPRPGKKPQTKHVNKVVDKVKQIEEMEISLLQRENNGQKELHERNVHVLPFQPSDPKWDQYSSQPLQLIVTFPELYPEHALNLKVIDEDTLPKSIILAINTRIDKHVSLLHQESIVPSGHTPIFKTLINWLDDNIVSICDKNHEICVSESDEDSDVTMDTSEEEELEDLDDNMESDYLCPTKRGTEIRAMELNLNKNVATLRLDRLKLTVQCTRCKNNEDIICTPENPSTQSCDKCQSCFAVTIHPDIVHPSNPSLCFMGIIGCKPVDVVLPFCDFTVACLDCQKESIVKGLSYGEPFQTTCRGCHSHLQIFMEVCKFFVHQSGPLDAMMTDQLAAVAKKKKRTKDGFVIQEGRPLPELGTCLHYKKSHRWLRFPCCGKAYPCDTCHDISEDHPMERANRMICGYCSKEQGYTGSKPCVLCGSDIAYVKTSAHWEGGTGCRNKTKMNKNDPHKYKHDNKTLSKKDERVGIKGKKTREKNHSSV